MANYKLQSVANIFKTVDTIQKPTSKSASETPKTKLKKEINKNLLPSVIFASLKYIRHAGLACATTVSKR